MKCPLFFLFFLLASAGGYAQSMEYSLQLSSGLFSFGGASATSTSFILISDALPIQSYTNNPYGNESSFSYGFSLQAQHVTKNAWIYGLQAGWESLSSKVTINDVSGFIIPSPPIEGKTILTNTFINLHPFTGKRLTLHKIDLDLTAGFDIGFCLASQEKGEATNSTGFTYTTNVDRQHPSVDLRPRINITGYYKKFGISLGYSYGLTNYAGNITGSDLEIYSRYFRIGLNYRLSF